MIKCGRLLQFSCLMLACIFIARSSGQSFRRVQVPHERIEEFVGGMRPVPGELFESLIDPHVEHLPSPLSSAVYEATLSGDVLSGTGSLRLLAVPADASRIVLGGRLAITSARWLHEDLTRPAVVACDGLKTVVLVDRQSNTLEFGWNSRRTSPENSAKGHAVNFELVFPDAFAQELRLRLPPALQVQAANALVEQVGSRANGDAIWSIRWSGRSSLNLSVVQVEQAHELNVRIDSDYRIQTSDFHAEINLHLSGTTSDANLEVQVDPALRIVKVESDGAPLEFAPAKDDESTLYIELPERRVLSPQDFSIRLVAVGKLQLNEMVKLPRIHPLANWDGESAHCRIDSMFTMVDQRLDRCVCKSIEPELQGEKYQFEFDEETGSIQLKLVPQPREIQSESIVVIRMQGGSVLAEGETRIQPRSGQLHDVQLTIDTANGWVLDEDSVEAIADTNTLPALAAEKRPSYRDGLLNISLDKSASTDQPIFVRYRLRNDSFNRESLLANQLAPLVASDSSGYSTWIYIRETPGLNLSTRAQEYGDWQLANDKVPLWLTRSLARLVEVESPRDIFLRHTPESKLVDIYRTEVKTQPLIRSSTNVEFGADSIRYEFDVDVEPKGKEIESLVVNFSPQTMGNAWTIVGRAEVPTVNRSVGANGMDRHEIRFRPIVEPFRLTFTCQLPRPPSNNLAVPLASVGNSQGGAGIIGITASDSMNLEIKPSDGLDAVPFAVVNKSAGSNRRYLALYRYDDASRSIPTLNVQYLPHQPEASAWIWRTDLRSYYSEKGRPRHRADFYLHSEAATELRLRFNGNYTIEAVEIDGVSIDPEPQLTPMVSDDSDGGRELVIPTGEKQQFQCVTVKYVEPDRALHAIDWLFPAMPDFDFRVLQQTWRVWLPRDYQAYKKSTVDVSHGWLNRLVGYFGTVSAAESEASMFRTLRRKWVPNMDDPVGLIHQLEILLGADWPFVGTSDSQQPTAEWGPRLAAIADTVKRFRPEFQLFIDREELRRVGVFADTPLPEPVTTSPRSAGMTRLGERGLVLVVQGQQAVITSASAAYQHATATDWMDDVSVAGDVSWFGSSRLIQVDQWNSNVRGQLWRPSRDDLEIGLFQAGWNPSVMNLTPNRKPLKIYHRDTTVACCCIVFCFSLAIGWRLMERRPRLVVVLICNAFAAALLLPQPGAMLACTCAWSVVAGTLLRITTKRRRKQKLQTPVASRLSPTRVAVGMVITVVLWNLPAESLFAQAEGNARSPSRLGEAVVYEPIDESGNPKDVVYVPSEIYQQIQQRNNQDSLLAAEYLIRNARYVGALPKRGKPIRLRVTFELISVADDAVFPLNAFSGLLLEDSLRVNRESRPVDRVGEHSSVSIGGRGDCEVSFDIVVPWTDSIDARRVDLTIPMAAIASLELRVPRGMLGIEVPTALGKVTLRKGILNASLGPVQNLSIVAENPMELLPDGVEVERVMRMHVGDKKTQMEVDFEFKEEPISLALRVDQGLMVGGGSSVVDWDKTDREKLRFVFDSPSGKFIVPEITPLNASLASSRLAVSSSGQKNVRVENGASPTSDVPTELPVGAGQQLDVYLETSESFPGLEVVDVPLVESWTSELSCFFDQLTARVEVKAQLLPEYDEARVIAVRRLRVPAYFKIHELSAKSATGESQRLRWHRNDDEIAIFFLDQLSASSSAPVSINLHGELTNGGNDSVALPVVELVSDRSDNRASVRNLVKIYRKPDVDIHMDGIGPFVPELVDAASSQRDGYRLYKAWVSEAIGFQSATDALTLRRQTLSRNITGSLTTRLIYDGDWTAEIEADLKCEQGIDVIYFDVPATLCLEPLVAYSGDARESLRVDTVRGGPELDRRIVAVWLPENPAVMQKTIYLVGSLTQDITHLPHIRLINVTLERKAELPQQYIELPRYGDDREDRFTWRRSGLTAVSESEIYFRFRVLQDNYQAELEEQQSGLQPKVSLLNTHVSLRDFGRYVAISEFDLQPARQGRLRIAVPDGAELTQVFCNDNHAVFSSVRNGADSPGSYFSLTSSPWPQRVRVIYRGTYRPSRDQVTVEAPKLMYLDGLGEQQPIVVGKEAWSIDAPSSFGFPEACSTDARPIDELGLDAVRISSFVEMWTGAQAAIRERPRSEKGACLSTWARYLTRSISRRPSGATSDSAWQSLEELIVEYPDAFAVFPDSTSLQSQDLWNESQWTDGELARFLSAPPSSDELPRLVVQYDRRANSLVLRIVIAASLVLASVFAARWPRGSGWSLNLSEFPHVVLAVLGGLWWLLLSPAWIGAGMVVIVALIGGWQKMQQFRAGIRQQIV